MTRALFLSAFIVILALAAVYVDVNGMWPDSSRLPTLPELPRLPPLPADVAAFRAAASKAVQEAIAATRNSAEEWHAAAAAAAERLKIAVNTFDVERATEAIRELTRRVVTAAASYRVALVAEFQRRR